MKDARTPRTFRALLLRSAGETHAWSLGGLGVLLTAAAWAFPKGLAVPFPAVLFAFIVGGLSLAVLFRAAFWAFEQMRHPLPAVRAARPAPSYYPGVLALCFLEPSDLFAHGSLVSFYLLEDGGFELLFGLGEVVTVQRDGLIQVGLRDVMPEHHTALAKLQNNDATLLRQLVVKPTVPRYSPSLGQDA